jgi:membrane complex biogenesis BtpA family protein
MPVSVYLISHSFQNKVILLKWVKCTMTNIALKKIFGDKKPIIGMVHFWIPSPSFRIREPNLSLFDFIANIKKDIEALQKGGVDGLLFVNESDKPTRNPVDYDVYAWFSLVVGYIMNSVKIPFGIEVLDDPIAGQNLASIFGAKFVRGNFLEQAPNYENSKQPKYTKWDISYETSVRMGVYANLKFDNFLNTESEVGNMTKKILVPNDVSGISISGFDVYSCKRIYSQFKSLNPTKDLILGSGVNLHNAKILNDSSDGMIIGSSFKKNGVITNEVDINRVKEHITSIRK